MRSLRPILLAGLLVASAAACNTTKSSEAPEGTEELAAGRAEADEDGSDAEFVPTGTTSSGYYHPSSPDKVEMMENGLRPLEVVSTGDESPDSDDSENP